MAPSSLDPPIPSTASAKTLIQTFESSFPTTLDSNSWYITLLAALCYVEPTHASTLYKFLLQKPEYATPGSEARKELIRKLRETLFKSVSVQGCCKPLEAMLAIIRVEEEEDREFSFSREHWYPGGEYLERGNAWLSTIYQHNLAIIDVQFSAHRDFSFLNHNITYGLYLSDMSILGPIETELVAATGIILQNLPVQSAWHLRGMRRVGIKPADVEAVLGCLQLVAGFGGISLGRVPKVADVEDEV